MQKLFTIEVGSTITKANGFVLADDGSLHHEAQGFAPTSVGQGDVTVGVRQALEDLKSRSDWQVPGIEESETVKSTVEKESRSETSESKPGEIFLNSSAAGGLRMTVHGLTYNMTARAAREAGLGAGAIIRQVTAGALTDYDLDELKSINPNLILLAGGVDYGEREVTFRNAERLASLGLKVPVIYAGNVVLKKAVADLFAKHQRELIVAPNVFPDIDVLNVDPIRKLIQEAFSRHIIHAPGMEKLSRITQRPVLPTPGAVLLAAELLAETSGDVLIFDVGGATTDVHSVTEGSSEFMTKLVDPEPRAKRTVEGDLGVYVNAKQILENIDDPDLASHLEDLRAMPHSEREKAFTRRLCAKAVEIGARRHAGTLSDLYTPTGRKQIVRGKDLTAVRWVIGTGGALTRIEGGDEILRSICRGPEKHLLPRPDATILLDRNYLFSALGTLAQVFPAEAARALAHFIAAGK